MEFACIGFDLRVSACQSYPSADYSEWDRDEEKFAAIQSALGIMTNEYSLLCVLNQLKLTEVIGHMINQSASCDLVALEMPREIIRSRNLKYGFNTPESDFDFSDFVSYGLDVCDINGLYTCFNHPEIAQFRQQNYNDVGLIPEANIELALEVAQYANYLDECHRPFVVVRVLSFRSRIDKGS